MGAARDAFIIQFPEFTNSTVSLVEACLAAAALEIDTEVWGDKATQGQYYLTAHKMALSPLGNNAQMFVKLGETTTVYWVHYQKLVRQVSSGYRVA